MTALTTVSRRRTLVEDEVGASAVEFALISPVLLLFVAGIIEGALLLHAWGHMEHVGRQAARAHALDQATVDQAKAYITDKMKIVFGSPTATPTVAKVTGASPLDKQVVVTVTLSGTELKKVLPFGLFGLTQLARTITLRQES